MKHSSIGALALWLFFWPLAPCAATPMLEAGADFSLFLSQDGKVQAVGSDAAGQLGQGRPLSTETPVAVKLDGARQIVAGAAHNLALATNGSIWAWGSNTEGQLGDGTTISRALPQAVSGLGNARAVSAGQYHSIAVLDDGSVRAWGNNRDGQLGDGSLASRPAPAVVTGLARVQTVAAGYNHSLALQEDGSVWAWGGNYWGQLGDGTERDANRPVQVLLHDGTPLKNIVAIAAGHSFSVAIDRDGNVMIWGYLYYDTAAATTRWVNRAWYKTDVPLAQSIAAGQDHVLVLDRDGYVWAWGDNYYGQLGDGTDSDAAAVTNIDAVVALTPTSIRAIAAGQSHSLAVDVDGAVWRWGFSRYAPDEDPDLPYFYNSIPSRMAVTTASAVAAGASHSLALRTNGQAMAWGNNADGQLGDGALRVRSIVAPIDSLSGIVQVSAGNWHALALRGDGSLWAWGAGRDGQLGNGRRIDVSQPVQVTGLTGIDKIAAAGKHSLALKVDGSVQAWGNNYYGQLGNGSDRDSLSPARVNSETGPLANIVAVCGGDWHSAAVDRDGAVWRWGYDYYDAATDTSYYFPNAVRVAGLPPARNIACGAKFTLVLARDGTVWGWGDNYFGQMGDGTDIDSVTPSQVIGLGGVTAIAAGYYHSLALKDDGTVWRWGYSSYDPVEQLDYYFWSPVAVAELTQVTGIAAGDWHSLALRRDGTVLSWGFNYAGQLADGTFEEFRGTPQLAVNTAVNGLLDLDPGVANNVDCPIVVQADKSGSIDAMTAGFKLFVGTQANCSIVRATRAASGYQVFVAANHAASGQWFLLKGVENNTRLPAPTWTQYLGGPLPVFAANAGAGGIDEHVQASLIEGADARQLAGFDVYVGYGASAEEMLAANRVKRILTLGVDGRPVMQK